MPDSRGLLAGTAQGEASSMVLSDEAGKDGAKSMLSIASRRTGQLRTTTTA
jgi:hypothetical protein